MAFLIIGGLVVCAPAPVRADGVGSLEEPIVRGEPVEPGGALGTVAIAIARDDHEPGAVPLDLSPVCSGVLIAPTVVLTAAHCLETCYDQCELPDGEPVECYVCEPELKPPSALRVLAGLRDIEDRFRSDTVEVVTVLEHFVPDSYVPSDSWPFDVGDCSFSQDGNFTCARPGLSDSIRDIAVLRLGTSIETAVPVPLASSVEGLEGLSAIATGYGRRTARGSDELLEQDHYRALLHETEVRIDRATELEILTETNDDRSGVCFGDSGGPLYVNRGGGIRASGVFSRFRADGRLGNCGRGAIYTATAAHLDWIQEKAPETLGLSLNGGAGCSTQPVGFGVPALWFAGLLALLLLLRRRARNAGSSTVALLLLALASACGSSGDASLCTDRYDPNGTFCDPSYPRVDLQAAEALARADVPEDALLLQARSSGTGVMDPDGRAGSWWFLYYLPGRATPPAGAFFQTQVTSSQTYPVGEELSERLLRCIPSEPLPVVDSRRLIHDAISSLEREGQNVSLADGGNLFVVMRHVCLDWASQPLNYVSYRGSSVVFDERGQVLAVVETDP